jgi:hypothetical protein
VNRITSISYGQIVNTSKEHIKPERIRRLETMKENSRAVDSMIAKMRCFSFPLVLAKLFLFFTDDFC